MDFKLIVEYTFHFANNRQVDKFIGNEKFIALLAEKHLYLNMFGEIYLETNQSCVRKS